MYLEDDVRERLIRKEIELYRTFAGCAEGVKKVVQAFDGKVINKRFDTALRANFEATGVYVGYEVKYGSFNISLSAQNDHVKSGEYSCEYAENRWEYFREPNKNNVLVNGRLVASAMCEAIDRDAERMTREAADLEESLSHIAEIRQKFNELRKACTELQNGTNYRIRQLYELNFERMY